LQFEKLVPDETQTEVLKLSNYKIAQLQDIPMSGFNLQEIMSQAKQQADMLQKKMESTVVEASSGAGTRHPHRSRSGESRRRRNAPRPGHGRGE